MTMTAVENAPELNIHSSCEADLVVDPSDITFHDLDRDTVLIRVRIRNEGDQRSSPTVMTLESALFGAFVPWRPLATVPVPALEPGESRVLSAKAGRHHPETLGDFDKVPPARVLTALDASPEQPTSPKRSTRISALLEQFRGRRGTPAARARVTRGPLLPADLWELFGREQPHWAGNINVFVGNKAVERHVAKALRIYSGRTNLAMFFVGWPKSRDAFAFNLVGLAPDWKAALYDRTQSQTLVVGSSDAPVQEKHWVEAGAGFMMVMLAVRPPLDCENGNLRVHVTRRSSQQTAVVEFNLSATAQGPGCYVA